MTYLSIYLIHIYNLFVHISLLFFLSVPGRQRLSSFSSHSHRISHHIFRFIFTSDLLTVILPLVVSVLPCLLRCTCYRMLLHLLSCCIYSCFSLYFGSFWDWICLWSLRSVQVGSCCLCVVIGQGVFLPGLRSSFPWFKAACCLVERESTMC